MNLTIKNRINFCDKFLAPISRISDMGILSLSNDTITSLCKTIDNNTILLSKYNDIDCDVSGSINLNISDIKKLIKLFDSLDDNVVNLKINSNNIEYTSSNIKFKFHLLEDGIIAPLGHSHKKIEQFEYDCKFSVNVDTLNKLLKSSAFITDSNKIYIQTAGDAVQCELTDKSKHNVDNFVMQISDFYIGSQINNGIPFTFDLFRNIATLKASKLEFNINTTKSIMCIDIIDDTSKLKYVSTGKVI